MTGCLRNGLQSHDVLYHRLYQTKHLGTQNETDTETHKKSRKSVNCEFL